MENKKRIDIPKNIAAEILFLSDRTCCVCKKQGKPIQIHHIDENPANNKIENLAVLCLECHNDTMVKGGFGRQLDTSQISLYKTEWLKRVKNRKDTADGLASIAAVTGSTGNTKLTDNDSNESYMTYNDPNLLKNYIEKIIFVQQKARLTIAQTKYDTGITAMMNEGMYGMIDFYEEVLIELSAFYPMWHFNNQNPKDYFSKEISSKFVWYRLIQEPSGIGTGGTMTTCSVGTNVENEIKEMIVDMVESLLQLYDMEPQVDLEEWRKKWLA